MKFALIAIIVGLSIGGCQHLSHKDSGGRSYSLSKPRVISLSDADLNLARFLNVPNLSVSRSIRDNGTSIIDTYMSGGLMVARTSRVTTSWYSTAVEQKLGRQTYLAELLKANATRYGADTPKSAPNGQYGRTTGFYSQKGKCDAFAVGYRLRRGATFDNDPGTPDTIVNFASCSALRAEVTTVISSIRRMTDGDRAAILSAPTRPHVKNETSSRATGRQNQDVTRQKSKPIRRVIAVNWSGIDNPVLGEVVMRPADGDISLTLPEVAGTCAGSYSMSDEAERKGNWSLACTNGLTATGSFLAFGGGKGVSGRGRDNKGRTVRYTISGY